MPRKSRISVPFSSARPSSTTTPSTSSKKPLTHSQARKRKHRSHDAFAIASADTPERTKVAQHRFGENAELDAEQRGPKRRRMQDGDEDEESEQGFDGDGGEGGSDVEGQVWKIGVEAGESGDESVDSEEAFGSGDEERFEWWTFQATSRRGGVKGRRGKGNKEVNLNENEEEDEGDQGSGDDDSLGSEAVDLAQMLDDDDDDDDDEEEEEEELSEQSMKKNQSQVKNGKNVPNPDSRRLALLEGSENDDDMGDFGGFSEDGEDLKIPRTSTDAAKGKNSESESEIESDDVPSESGNDDNDPEKLEQLHEALDSLPKPNQDSSEDESTNNANPDAKRMIAALKNMSNLDPALARSMRKLTRANEDASRGGKPEGRVQVPLPKRQQDKIDRSAAYTKAKDTLNRWINTVKHNRRAEHLSFPLTDPTAQEAQGTTRLLQASTARPRTELESTIQGILEQSGLAGPESKSEEKRVQEAEELQASKMPLEEVMTRRAELRKQRDLLFREEQRAKRIKKIKSKAYRRVHRKEREKNVQREKDMMAAAGVEMSDEEREKHDRRRAEERMGARHRENRWAKGMKASGRAMWDEEARSGVTEMARRNEELRQRMEGQSLRPDNDDGSDADEDEDEDLDVDDKEEQREKLKQQLDGIDASQGVNQSKLGSMKFMQRAEARQQQANVKEVKSIRRELAGEESQEDSEPELAPGRRVFGLNEAKQIPQQLQNQREQKENEFEEGSASEGEDLTIEQQPSSPKPAEPSVIAVPPGTAKPKPDGNKPKQNMQQSTKSGVQVAKHPVHYLELPRASSDGNAEDADELDKVPSKSQDSHSLHLSSDVANRRTVSDAPPSQTSRHESRSQDLSLEVDSDANDAAITLDSTNEELVKAAFGIDDTAEADFSREKQQAAESEDDQIVDTKLPGWGSWTGAGIAPRRKQHPKAKSDKDQGSKARASERNRFLVKMKEGVRPQDRKDANLKDVILSEKRVKKNVKYMASTLPHPFESKTQYERSLRVPVGPEWTTKESFQKATKPRVLLKQGIIGPMERPLL